MTTQTDDRAGISFRNPALVLSLLTDLLEVYPDPIEEHEIEDRFVTDDVPPKTLEATLYDLRRFGALYRTPKQGRKPPLLRATKLGKCWVEGVLPGLPGRAREATIDVGTLLEDLRQIAALAHSAREGLLDPDEALGQIVSLAERAGPGE